MSNNLEMCTDDLGTCGTDLGICDTDLGICDTDLDTCETDLQTCIDESQIFPGDGYPDTDAIGLPGHGPALSYTDNGDGTFTDDNTGCMWEIKDDNDAIHDKDNTYNWSDGGTAPNGDLFTDFLDTLNNTCRDDEAAVCTTNGDSDCAGVGGACGFAGYRDWEIPNVKLLQSIVDYSVSPSSSVPGATRPSVYWSSTTFAFNTNSAWFVDFGGGSVSFSSKLGNLFARAVRPCS